MKRFVASFAGVGLILRRVRGSDAGSGTLAAAVVLAFVLLVPSGPAAAWLAAAAVAVAVSVWSSGPFTDDPGWVVIDEVAGALVAVIGLGGWPAVVAWVVFRIADITKRFPGVRWAEELGGRVGVTADDVVAGLYGLACGWLVQSF